MNIQRDVSGTQPVRCSPFFHRHFFALAGLLLAMMAAVQIGSALQENPTNDEAVHVTAGYVYLTTGEYSMDLEHPPLGRVLAALPLLTLPLKHIPAERAWSEFKALIWKSPVSAETILFRARLVTITFTFLFGAWIAWWTRRWFGPLVALLALAFFAFDPTFIAHGHYVTTDVLASFGIFLACTLWANFLHTPSRKSLVAASLGLGFALASKYSAAYLLLILPLLYGVAWWQHRGEPFFTFRGALRIAGTVFAGAALFVVVPYAPEVKRLVFSQDSEDMPADPPIESFAAHATAGEVAAATVPATGLLAFSYFRGLYELTVHNAEGHPAYLLGDFRLQGWWYYFPVAFLVKTPTGVLLACIIAVCSLWYHRKAPMPAPLLLCLGVPPVAFFAMAMRSSINIGFRHILPIYAFLYVLLAFALIQYGPYLLRRAWQWTVVGVLLLVGVESVSIYPHYLAFFNRVSGGPINGSHYLLDSNIDWGQDVENLAAFVRDRKMTPLCTALFSAAPVSYYGITARDLNQTGTPEGVENLPCVVAISVNLLQGLYNSPAKYAALRRRQPLARIGYSVYLYDLRH